MTAGLLQKSLQSKLNTCRIQQILAPVAPCLHRRGQDITRFVFVDKRIHIAVADRVHHRHQIAQPVGGNRVAELDLRADLVALGHRHLAHVVAETGNDQLLTFLAAERRAHPVADLRVGAGFGRFPS